MPMRIKARKTENGVIRMDGYQIVPCGKCNACRQRRINGWVMRLQAEDRHWCGGLFVTLTYDSDHVPITPKKFMTVDKRDIQLFMKRMRFNSGKKCKYYVAAEYGSKTYRPHYHAIIFGVDQEDIKAAWPHGEIHVGQVSGASIAYTLKYISKERQVPMHPNDDRVREFSLMSKHLGISYLTLDMVNWHITNKASFTVKQGGVVAALPRYYRDKIFTQEQRDYLNLEQQELRQQVHEKQVEQAGSLSEWYRLRSEFAAEEKFKLSQKHINCIDKL